MNQNIPEQDNFEEFFRKELEKTPLDPHPLDWETIATQQKPINRMLQLRYYAPKALMLIGLAAAIGWGVSKFGNRETTPPPQNQAIAQTVLSDNPVAKTNVTDVPEPVAFKSNTNKKQLSNAWAQWVRQIPIPLANHSFQAEKGTVYTDKRSGSKVSIPAGALVYADGSPVKGEVDLFYREFRDIPDFLASGIPMHYQDGQGEFFFNSAGMFEVRAEQNQQALYLAPGQTYDVDFQATRPLSDLSLYQLKDQTKQWSFVPSALTGQNQMPTPVSDGLVAKENTATSESSQCSPNSVFLPDGFSAFEGVRRGILAGRQYASGELKIPEWFSKYPNAPEKFYLDALERGHVRLVSALDNKTLFFVEDKSKIFTELAAFEDCYFESVGDTLSNQEGKVINLVQEIVRKNPVWKRIEIIPDEEGATGLIYLGQEKEGVKMHFRLCQSQSAQQSGKPFNPKAIFQRYLDLRKENQKALHEKIGDLLLFCRTSQMFKQEAEWCYDDKAWLLYFQQETKKMKARYDALAQSDLVNSPEAAELALKKHRSIVREKRMAAAEAAAYARSASTNLQISLRVSGFGIFNCDQIFRLSTGGELAWINAQFNAPNQTAIQAGATYIIDRNTNMFLELPRRGQLLYSPSHDLAVVVVAPGGKKYFLSYDEYARIKRPSLPLETVQVQLADVSDTKSPKEWAALLDI